jgi:hypothetical protein
MASSLLLSLWLLLSPPIDAFSSSMRIAATRAPIQKPPLFARTSSILRKATLVSETSLKEEDEKDEPLPDDNFESAGQKLSRLKDLMWVRETLEDLTASEFACTVEAENSNEEGKRRIRAVDYEKLLVQLNRRIQDMGCNNNRDVKKKLKKKGKNEPATWDFSCVLQPGVGMGSMVYSDKQRDTLLERILQTRQLLLEVIEDREVDFEVTEHDLPFSITFPDLRVPKEDDGDAKGPKLYVRDDGTVDWDGALQDKAALREFGTAVWARINGRDPETLDEDDDKQVAAHSNTPDKVTAKIAETPQIARARRRLFARNKELAEMETVHTKLLNSALYAGQAVANVQLAALAPELRNEIRFSVAALELQKEKVTFQKLIYELERIYTYLLGELVNPALKGYIPLQDRLNVAEFGLLAVQIDNFNRQFETDENLDADLLLVVMDQVTDFKRRLGIDYYVTGMSFDSEAIKRWSGELLETTKKGIAFCVKGIQLLANDIAYCFRLVNRAAQGYTLKAREVRTLR